MSHTAWRHDRDRLIFEVEEALPDPELATLMRLVRMRAMVAALEGQELVHRA
jgi:hypothetical protein